MPRACSICTHPQRDEIETALGSGLALRNVAGRFETSPAALHRHRKHAQGVATGVQAVTDAGQPKDGNSNDAKEDEELELLPREEKLASLLAQGNITVAEACRQCGFNPTSSTIRNRLKPGGDIHQHVVSRMRELGLTLDVGLLKVRGLLDATKEVLNPAMGSNAAHMAAMVKETTVPPTLELRDNESQRWAAEQTLKLHGAYPKQETKEEPGKGAGPIVAIEFVSRQHASGGPTEQRVTALLDFAPRSAGNGHNGGAA